MSKNEALYYVSDARCLETHDGRTIAAIAEVGRMFRIETCGNTARPLSSYVCVCVREGGRGKKMKEIL